MDEQTLVELLADLPDGHSIVIGNGPGEASERVAWAVLEVGGYRFSMHREQNLACIQEIRR